MAHVEIWHMSKYGTCRNMPRVEINKSKKSVTLYSIWETQSSMGSLFSVSYDIAALPRRTQQLLSYSSLWMLVPVALGNIRVLQVALACACIFSTCCWADPRTGSWLHVLDKVFAWLVYLLMVLYSPISVALGFSILLYISFTARSESMLHQHYLFRFIFFWWVYGIMVSVPTPAVFCTLSVIYWAMI
jgi:hypothetical protein